ncbi:methyl-accepting chemotaxis protein [Clostridium tetani]|uniref:methyl-accepting chemotaxis protein n=1 Tax=Clostridium tetani TaxID=1513 RepID=UPI00100BBC3D|nr:methyl-accepting chemotaxis protein [Clostridium tetani]RXM58303.1 methyl-accepting chemotaxis protein [Clostridium tetani]RXM78627.1 methyl-accepting chemotaxis protein [Clostridium tetani]RYU99773.1 methyl-accepting chemotaxis protein [Clostridium tetani]
MKISKFLKRISIIFTIIIIANTISLWKLNQGVKSERETASKQIEFYKLGVQLQDASDYLTEQVRIYTQFGEKEFYNNYWKEVNETKTKEKVIEKLKELGIAKEELDILSDAKKNSDILTILEQEAIKAIQNGDLEKGRKLVYGKEYDNNKEKIGGLVNQFIEKINTRASNESILAIKRADKLVYITYTLITFLILLIIFTFIILIRKIELLGDITKRLEELASNDGDLTSRINISSKDEIGEIAKSFNKFTNKIREIIIQVGDIAEQVAASSQELTAISQESAIASEDIAKTIEDIAIGAGEQARDVEIGNSNVNELQIEIEKNQDDVTKLNYVTDEINKLKEEGFEVIKDLVEKTVSVNNSIEEIRKIITNTNESAVNIENNSKMIKNISEQTNLLALNAAIEAARVGESGKGFAVVADEIRKLAEETNKFTGEIDTIIKDLTNKTESAVSAMEIVKEIVRVQTQSVNMTNSKFKGIAESIEKGKLAIADLNESEKQMINKKDEIIKVIYNLSSISEENASGTEQVSASVEEQTASMEEISNASEALAKLAEQLQKNINKFKY